jgi:cell division protein FtsB
MINRINELKTIATEKAHYFSAISFPNLANTFTEFANFFSEIEAIVKQNEELTARVQVLEAELQNKEAIPAAAKQKEDNNEIQTVSD